MPDLAARVAQGPWSGREVGAVFERGLRAPPGVADDAAAEARTLHAALARPEFEPLLDLFADGMSAAEAGRWRIGSDGRVAAGPAALRDPAAAAFHLRFAAELALLGRLAPDAFPGTARALLALHTALSYYLQMTRQERAAVRTGTGGGWTRALAAAESGQVLALAPGARCAILAELLADITAEEPALQPMAAPAAPAAAAACAQAAPLLVAAQPAERLLTLGGDDRLLVCDDSGLNGYGCSPRPRPWAITFSSSTASSISEQAFGAVEQMRRELLRAGLAGGLDGHLDALARGTRRAIAATLGIDEAAAELVLTASGTDAELIALWLAMGRAPGRPILNVIVGPEEVGSGSVPAAGGRHFNPLSPLGGAVEPGEMLAGFPSGRIRVEMLAVRDDAGQPLPGRDVGAELVRVVGDAVALDETVLLHLVDCSKTGLMSPDLAAVRELVARHPGRIVVVVDAAQMRLSRAMLSHYLGAGFIVLVTGSKFFTGPPFSGAVVVPRGLLASLPGLVALPPGLAAYATAGDFPDAFREHTAGLPRGCNVGLLARWHAALWEMAAFHAVPPADRRRTIAAFDAAVRMAIGQLPELELASAPARPRIPDGGWDSVPSIFTFVIRRRGEAIDYADGRRVYNWLNRDVAGCLPADAPAEDRRLAAQCCHTPQPVKLGRRPGGWTAGMRIAAGARLVSGVHMDPRLGATPAERLRSELRDMETVLRKAAMIGRRWDDFAGAPGRPGAG